MLQQKKLQSITHLKVRFQECDPLQIVWHGNYLKYFEEGREEFGREHGISYLHAKYHGFSTPVVSSLCEHKLPLHYGDVFEVHTHFINNAAAKITFEYKIYNTEKLVCTGKTVQVFLNEKRELVLGNPPFFVTWKQKMGLL